MKDLRFERRTPFSVVTTVVHRGTAGASAIVELTLSFDTLRLTFRDPISLDVFANAFGLLAYDAHDVPDSISRRSIHTRVFTTATATSPTTRQTICLALPTTSDIKKGVPIGTPLSYPPVTHDPRHCLRPQTAQGAAPEKPTGQRRCQPHPRENGTVRAVRTCKGRERRSTSLRALRWPLILCH